MDDAWPYVPFLQAPFLISAHHFSSSVLFRVLFFGKYILGFFSFSRNPVRFSPRAVWPAPTTAHCYSAED
jgi:hypothetical protein